MVGFLGLFAPAGTPQAVLDRLIGTLGPAMSEPETAQRLVEGGNENEFMLGDALGKRVVDDTKFFFDLARETGIQPR